MPETEEIISGLVAKARTAQKQVENYTQEQIDEVCLAVGWQVYKDENIAACAKIAVEETGMCIYEDKLKKHKIKVLGVACEGVHSVESADILVVIAGTEVIVLRIGIEVFTGIEVIRLRRKGAKQIAISVVIEVLPRNNSTGIICKLTD